MQSVLTKRDKEEVIEIKLLKDQIVLQFYFCVMLFHLFSSSLPLTGAIFTLGQFRADSLPNVWRFWEEVPRLKT